MTIINHKGQLFHYRGREEFKDNNAAAFKFTPTDEIWPLHEGFAQQHYHPAYSRSLSDQKPQCPLHSVTYPPQSPLSKESPQLHMPATHNVFNEHIKPDLINSRLRLGPSVLRSAVDTGRTSPSKAPRVHERGWEGLLLGQQSRRGLHNSSLTTSTSEIMNPSAAAFTPSSELNSIPFEPIDPVNLSLARALAEKTDEVYTLKAALEAESVRRIEVEQELARVSMLNKSLTSSVNMLGSIVKHNSEKPSVVGIATLQAKQQMPTSKSAAASPLTAPVSDTSTSILYDALQRQRRQYEDKGYPESKDDIEKTKSAEEKPETDLKNSDDLQLEIPIKVDESHLAALSRTLRKHFFSSEESIKKTPRSITKQDNFSSSDGNLVELSSAADAEEDSPSRIVRNQIAGTLDSCRKALDLTKSFMYPSRPSVVEHFQSAQESRPPIQEQKNTASPYLSLPTSILAKYGRPPPKDAVSPEPARSEERIVSTLGSVTPQSGCRLSYSESPTPTPSEKKTSNPDFNTLCRPTHIKVLNFPYTTTIYWNVHANNPIFDDEDDREIARRHTSAHSQVFWDHPVRYLPRLSEKNLYRTVMIDFIPVGCTYHDVLNQIHGGTIESIQLFPPIGGATDFMTARVVFVYEASAHGLYLRDQKKQIHIGGQQVRLWQVLQPTYPRHPHLTQAISEGATRMLAIINISEVAEQRLRQKLLPQKVAGLLIAVIETFDGYPLYEFNSIAEAVKAASIVQTDPGLGGTMAVFENDPCESNHYAPEEAL